MLRHAVSHRNHVDVDPALIMQNSFWCLIWGRFISSQSNLQQLTCLMPFSSPPFFPLAALFLAFVASQLRPDSHPWHWVSQISRDFTCPRYHSPFGKLRGQGNLFGTNSLTLRFSAVLSTLTRPRRPTLVTSRMPSASSLPPGSSSPSYVSLQMKT